MKRFLSLLIATMILFPAMTFAKYDSVKVSKPVIHTHVLVMAKDKDGKTKISNSHSNTLSGTKATIDSILEANSLDSLKHLIISPKMDFAFDKKNSSGNIIDITSGITLTLLLCLLVPIIIILIIIGISMWNSYNRNKLIREIIASGQNVHESLLKEDYNKKGVKNISLGVGLTIFFGMGCEDFIIGISIGAIAICLGIGQLICNKLEKKDNTNITNNTTTTTEQQ